MSVLRPARMPPPARRPPRHGTAATVAVLAATALALTACGEAPAGRARIDAAARHDGATAAGGKCRRVVHGVTQGPGMIAAAWLPAGFHLARQGQRTSTLPAATYVQSAAGPNAPRLQLTTGNYPGKLTPTVGGQSSARRVAVEGHRGYLETGQPDTSVAGVYWKPDRSYLISVVGFHVRAAVVLKAARHVTFTKPGIIALPVVAGPAVGRQAAITAARHRAGAGWPAATAKLSSWSEISALLPRGRVSVKPSQVPASLQRAPWRPAWAVLLSRGAGSSRRSRLVVVDAQAGQPELATIASQRRQSWYSELADRAARSQVCLGGSTSLVPFGVLTRDEASYADGWQPPVHAQHATTTMHLLLSTVPAVNKADNGLYGGCIQQSCSVGELVWVTIVVVRADPGTTVSCLPGSVSVPPNYKPNQVRQYYSISVPDNDGIGCGPVPHRISNMRDLAPPGR
jgi:hypothetical protein